MRYRFVKDTKVPSNIDGKNVSEDFLEELADGGKAVRSKNCQMLFFYHDIPIRAHWVEGQNMMTLNFNQLGECYSGELVEDLATMFEGWDDTYVIITKMNGAILLSFWKK